MSDINNYVICVFHAFNGKQVDEYAFRGTIEEAMEAAKRNEHSGLTTQVYLA